MAVGDLITTARFNNLQSRIETILGTGTGSDGYGQTTTSSQVVFGQEVLASSMASLYLDMVNARVHQTGAIPSGAIAPIQTGDLVAEETSSGSDAGLKGIADFERLIGDIEADRFVMHPSQATLETAITTTRTTAWNGTLTHEVTVTFASPDDRRFFFNAGGEIRFAANISGGTGDKTNDWRVILQNIGTVKFNYTETISTGTGSGSGTGNYELTNVYTPIFVKTGSGAYALYSANSYTIEARAPDWTDITTQGARIQFKIVFNDASTDRTIDNDVTGSLTSTLQMFRPDSDAVRVLAPNFSNTQALS
jgi:hypothetical protein